MLSLFDLAFTDGMPVPPASMLKAKSLLSVTLFSTL